MNSFRQHIPAFARDGREPSEPKFLFETTADLLALEVVQRYKGPTFSHWAMSENTLMEISDDGYRWWVVGFIEKPDQVDLPQWDGGKYLARLADGREVTLTRETTPHVQWSSGGRLGLTDGSEAVDVRFERQMAKQDADRKKEADGICPKCDVAFSRTETPTDRGMIEVKELCQSCGRSITRWRHQGEAAAEGPRVVALGRTH